MQQMLLLDKDDIADLKRGATRQIVVGAATLILGWAGALSNGAPAERPDKPQPGKHRSWSDDEKRKMLARVKKDFSGKYRAAAREFHLSESMLRRWAKEL